ncbi:helix-turn-helix transcriptional regulator [Tenacibaculum amylolyticum]|uniref:helix-turn-helix transcriptional regulator n=1 Tax=Tenacibaculum amylolyticum TaxID=104269 RepID=UPI003892EF51
MLLHNISFLEVLSFIAILHCFVLSFVILFSKFFRSSTNKYLGITLFIIGIVGLNNWYWDRGMNPQFINVLDIFLWQFLYPITLFQFFYGSSKQHIIKSKYIRFLYLPFFVLSIINCFIYLSTIFKFYELPTVIEQQLPLFYRSISFLSIVFPLGMILLSHKQIALNKELTTKKWLLYLWYFFLVIELLGIALEVHRFLYSEKLPLTYVWALTSILIYWLIYKGLYQFKLSNDQYEIRTITKKQIPTTIATQSKNAHFQKLITLLEEEQLHHNPNLSRDMIAEQLGISNGYLSQILKEHASSSFSDFINSYRIKDVKKMMKDPQFDKYSLLAIGLECGFNSKTSFYTNFKKQTGLTPKEFKNK